MIPTEFDYVRAGTLDEAISLLAKNEDAKILAGGHSLIPAMKLRLAAPPLLVDIGRIKDLSYIREEDGQIRIGAMTTHYQIESSDLLKKICPLLPECAAQIGDVQVRNKGTLGGSLAHADPAGDWPAAILALDAELQALSARGERWIPAREFFRDLLTTTLQGDEILTAIRVPQLPARSGDAYLKLHHPASGFAVVGVAARVTLGENGSIERAAVGITGIASKAYRAAAVENALVGKPPSAKRLEGAAAHAADGVEANADLYASAEYRTHLARVYTRRALDCALERAGGK